MLLRCFPSSKTMIVSATLVATLSFPVLAQDANHPLRLKEAVQIAVDRNPLLSESAEKIQQYNKQVPLTRSLLFPNLSLIGTGTEQKDSITPGTTPKFNGDPYNAYQAKLHLAQPLYVFGSMSGIDSAHKDVDQRKLETEIARRNLVAQVIQGYYQVVLTMRTIDLLHRQERIEREALSTSESRSRTGRGQVLDVLQIKTNLALLHTQIANNENQLQIAAATLANLLGDDKAREFHVRNQLEAPSLRVVDSDVNLKNFHLPELEKNKISIEQIDDLKRVQLGQNLPSLNATADYMYSAFKQSDLFDDDSKSWAVGLQLTIPIFSGFSMHYQQEVLNSQRMQLEYDRSNIQNTANLQQVSSRKQLETAAESISEAEETLKLAVASSNEARRMYRYATIDFLNFLTVENNYVTAESSLDTYKTNYIVALSNYYVSSGQDISHLVDLLEKANP